MMVHQCQQPMQLVKVVWFSYPVGWLALAPKVSKPFLSHGE